MVHRMPAHPIFDVAGTEQWLEDMARQGLHLSREGFCGISVSFEKGEPKAVRYRMEAASESTSMWSKNDGYPSTEALELHEALGWEYVSNRGEFNIYRTENPEAPEPDTDPHVKAIALGKVKERLKSSLVSLFFWTVLYPLIFFKGTFFLISIEIGTWFFLAGLLLVLWGLVDAIRQVLTLKKLQRQLEDSGTLKKMAVSRRSMFLYYGKKAAKVLLVVLWAGHLFLYLGNTADESRRVPLDRYDGELPFATILDFAGDDASEYRATMSGMGFNTILEWSDVLAPRCISYHENAQTRMADGSLLSGGLIVDYYETRAPWIARVMASELHRQDRWEREYAPIESPELQADCVFAYQTVTHFPTVVLQKGKVVVRAQFYQLVESQLSLDEWAGILADSLG